MSQCEHDRRTGESVALALPGKEYKLSLQGEKWKGQRWVGSEYYTSKPDHYWFEGVGVAEHSPSGRVVHFTFCTWLEEHNRDRELEDFVLISSRWDSGRGGYEKKLSLVESRRTGLIDHICEKIFRNVESSKKLVLEVVFGQMSYDWLFQNGFVFDETGQANLPDILSSSPA